MRLRGRFGGELVSYSVKPNYRMLGPRFGKNMPEVAAAVSALPADELAAKVSAAQNVTVELGGEEHVLAPEDLLVDTEQRENYAVEQEGDMTVALATMVTPELAREGLARELLHHVQNTRKAAGLEIEDRIHLALEGPQQVVEVIAEYGDWLRQETLSETLTMGPAGGEGMAAETGEIAPRGGDGGYREELKVNGLPVAVTVAKA